MPSESVTPETWQSVLAGIREKVSPQQFETWFRGVRLGRAGLGHVELVAPNGFVREWLQKKYSGLLREAVARATGWDQPDVVVVVAEGAVLAAAAGTSAGAVTVEPVAVTKATPEAAAPSQPKIDGGIVLNRDYCFDNFVVGPHNELAVAAAKAVV